MRCLPKGAGGPRRACAVYPVRFQANRQWSIRREDQGVGSGGGHGSPGTNIVAVPQDTSGE